MTLPSRIVVKVGTSLLINPDTLSVRYAFLHGLLSDIAALRAQGCDVVLTSSGAVAVGLRALGLTAEAVSLQDKQAAAACGMPLLLNAYKTVAQEYGFDIAQVLVTIEDMEQRRRFLNIKSTVRRVLTRGVMPILNENDTVTTEELRVGDNDRLAAKAAEMIGAESLVILTSIDGLYDRNPEDPGAQFVDTVEDVSDYLDVTRSVGALGSGGMLTKMLAANMAQNAGCETLIAYGALERPISAPLTGERRRTRCPAKAPPRSALKLWLANRLQATGGLVMSDAAIGRLETGGVEAADVRAVNGAFQKGDVVHIFDEVGVERARGLANFSADEAALLVRRRGEPVDALLGYKAETTLINDDNILVLNDCDLTLDAPEKNLLAAA